MPDLVIRIKQKSDGAAALSCTRADGSVTWQRQDGQLGAVFPPHDLTHYAVETVLGFRRGFYGLIAEGWDISDFAVSGSRGPIPEEARLVELLVGYFDLERMTGTPGTADEYNERIRMYYAGKKVEPIPFSLTEVQVVAIRALRGETIARWKGLGAGDAMELTFDRTATAASS